MGVAPKVGQNGSGMGVGLLLFVAYIMKLHACDRLLPR